MQFNKLRQVFWQRALVAAAIGLAAYVVSSTPARAETWDLATDFSLTSNPSTNDGGVWSYVYGSYPGTLFNTTYSNWVGVGETAWAVGPGSVPGLALETTATNPAGLNVLTGQVFGHDPNTDTPLTVRWTAPADMVIDITGDTWMLRDLGRNETVELLDNGVDIISPTEIPALDPGTWDDTHPFTLADAATADSLSPSVLDNIFVHAGDTIDIQTQRINEEDFTGFDLTITSVPEPGSLALLGLGSLALVFRRGRRRAQAPSSKN